MSIPRFTGELARLEKFLRTKESLEFLVHSNYTTVRRVTDGTFVVKLPHGKDGTWPQTHVGQTLRRNSPALWKAWLEETSTKRKKREEVKTEVTKKSQEPVADETAALKIRIDACMKDNDFKSRASFVDWCMEVGNEENLKVWVSKGAGEQALYGIENGLIKLPAEWQFTLINKAIDEAYSVEAIEENTPEVIPEPVVKPVMRRDPVTPKQEVQNNDTSKDDAIVALRDRYIDKLMKGVEDGNTDAMDRIEKIIGLK